MKKLNLKNLTKKELSEIEGGIIPLAVAWGICKIVPCIGTGAYGAGYAIGQFHGYSSKK
jgi:lactobin A/cerein 7B family class IIb bacteriocin